MTVIKKDLKGIETINDLLKDTSKMNDRIRNLFDWPEKRKKNIQYNPAYLYYTDKDYFFKFISTLKYSKYEVIKWSVYKPQDHPVLIQDDQGTFLFSADEPHIVIVSKADWLFKHDPAMNDKYRQWIYKAYDAERQIWRDRLDPFYNVKPLF